MFVSFSMNPVGAKVGAGVGFALIVGKIDGDTVGIGIGAFVGW